MKEILIKSYIDKLTINDIKKFAKDNDIIINNDTYEYIYQEIKSNWHTLIFGNPDYFFKELKTRLPQNMYLKAYSLYQMYKEKFSHYL